MPVAISLGLLRRAMAESGPFSRFLIDGFPRNSDNVKVCICIYAPRSPGCKYERTRIWHRKGTHREFVVRWKLLQLVCALKNNVLSWQSTAQTLSWESPNSVRISWFFVRYREMYPIRSAIKLVRPHTMATSKYTGALRITSPHRNTPSAHHV